MTGPAATPVDRERLEALLGGPAVAWLRDRIRRRLEHGGTLAGTVTLTDPTDAERAAVDRLLGRRPSSGARVTVSLDAVDRLLRDAQVCDGLRAAVEVLDGPIADVAGRRAAEEAAWAELLAPPARAHDVAGAPEPPWRAGWRADLAASGLLRRLADDPADARRLLADADRVLAALPVRGSSRARVAAETLGDSHGLDDDRVVTTLVLKALQHQHLPADERGPLPTGADRRALWAAAGVALDELSAPVLVLNLPAAGDGIVDRLLAAHAAVGEPARCTLRQLLRHPPDWSRLAGRTVHVCENPAVVAAAADALGAGGAPLVCTDGQPSSAVQTLLRALRSAGTDLAYHGDFDRGGLRIATTVVGRFGARLWRFDADAYRAAPAGPPLGGRVEPVAWAPGLADAINARGVAVHEEQVLDDLLADLGPS